MLKGLIRAVAGVVALGMVGTASAVPVLFTYEGSVTSVSGAPLSALMSSGDTITIDVLVDNGSSSLLSQTWAVSDTISATMSAGFYSVVFLSDFFMSSAATGFATDGLGTLTATNWFGIATPSGTDNFGSPADLDNGSGSASGGNGTYSYTPTLGTVSAWSGPVFASVPEPGALALLALGLAGIGIRGRRKFH